MIPRDKKLHMAVGFGISAIFTITAVLIDYDPFIGFTASFVAGMLKEVWDDHGPGHEDFMDFYATAAPGIIPPLVAQALLV